MRAHTGTHTRARTHARTYARVRRVRALTRTAHARAQTRQKAEIQALSSFGFQYLSNVYLPRKLQEGDWV